MGTVMTTTVHKLHAKRCAMYMYMYICTCVYKVIHMKINVSSMLAKGVHKHTQQTNKQAATMASLNIRVWRLRKIISHNGLEKQDI